MVCRLLDHNKLDGTIPLQVSILTVLQSLYIMHNIVNECWIGWLLAILMSVAYFQEDWHLLHVFKELWFSGTLMAMHFSWAVPVAEHHTCAGSVGNLSMVLSELQPCWDEITALYTCVQTSLHSISVDNVHSPLYCRNLGSKQLHGTIPSQISHLSALQYLYLSELLVNLFLF